MEFIFIPGSNGQSRKLFYSTDVSCVRIGKMLNQERHAFPCLTMCHSDPRQFNLLWRMAREFHCAKSKPQVYLDRRTSHPVHSSTPIESTSFSFAFRFLFQGNFAILMRGILSLQLRKTLGRNVSDVEVTLFGRSRCKVEFGEPEFGLDEFLSFYREIGFFYLDFCDKNTDLPRSIGPLDFQIRDIVDGRPWPDEW